MCRNILSGKENVLSILSSKTYNQSHQGYFAVFIKLSFVLISVAFLKKGRSILIYEHLLK